MRPSGAFSAQLPTLQLVIDQTSLGLFKECPRKYYYRMIEGWSTRYFNVHLSFGSWFHEGCEKYERARASGLNHIEALRVAVRHALASTWDPVLGKPWNSDNKDKNRYSLIRTLVWYLDDLAGSASKTVVLANGQPAVELTFKYIPQDYETGEELTSFTGEPIFFSGHLDSMIELQDATFISDRKTTSRRLGPGYFAAYTPDNQFSMYTHAGHWAFSTDVSGVICDAIQVSGGTSRFERQIIYRTEAQLREWYSHTKFYISLMGQMAEQNRWPMNDKACFMCQFRPVCARTPAARQTWLETDYTKEIWDPSISRGE
jgi:hypothetical protein